MILHQNRIYTWLNFPNKLGTGKIDKCPLEKAFKENGIDLGVKTVIRPVHCEREDRPKKLLEILKNIKMGGSKGIKKALMSTEKFSEAGEQEIR